MVDGGIQLNFLSHGNIVPVAVGRLIGTRNNGRGEGMKKDKYTCPILTQEDMSDIVSALAYYHSRDWEDDSKQVLEKLALKFCTLKEWKELV